MATDNTRTFVYTIRTEVKGLDLTVTVKEAPDSGYDKVNQSVSLAYQGRVVFTHHGWGTGDYDGSSDVAAFEVAKLLSKALYGENIFRLPMSPVCQGCGKPADGTQGPDNPMCSVCEAESKAAMA